MAELYYYKLWNPNLNQFVAQADKRPPEQIHALGGLIILDGGHPMSNMRPEREDRPVRPVASPIDELIAH